MAFDAGMLACTVCEIATSAIGSRIDKINQPSRDEVVFLLHTQDGDRRLLISAGQNPRISFSEGFRENPAVAPNFCMLLRKHLSGAKLSGIRQADFERVAILEFAAHDDLGFSCTKYLYAEMLGKYANLIFANEQKKILGVVKPVDFSMSEKRQVLSGMTYELPPQQDKQNPLTETREGFLKKLATFPQEKNFDRFILSEYLGISTAVAREISYLATGYVDQPIEVVEQDRAWYAFSDVTERIRERRFAPCVVYDGKQPVEYAFLPLTQYGYPLTVKSFGSAGEALDTYYSERDREITLKQKAADILKILGNSETRIRKKLEAQRSELADCDKGESYRLFGELITANLYLLKTGMKSAMLTDYGDCLPDGTFGQKSVTLDERLTPAQNAQRYFKKYAKSKSARIALTAQVEKDVAELEYVASVSDALTHAETTAELSEIREELYRSGYASRMKGYVAPRKPTTPTVSKFCTTNGLLVLCGKNNLQNEYVTHKLAEKTDYWFHAKGVPGSHVVLVTNGTEPDAQDFTDAAEIAAFYSGAADGQNVAVDYTYAKNVKKPAGGKPGLVIYHTNWTAYVTPDADKIASERRK